MQSVKKFIARAKIEEVRVAANSIDAPHRCIIDGNIPISSNEKEQ